MPRAEISRPISSTLQRHRCATWSFRDKRAFTWQVEGVLDQVPVPMIELLEVLDQSQQMQTSLLLDQSMELRNDGYARKVMGYWIMDFTTMIRGGRASIRELNAHGRELLRQWYAASAVCGSFLIDGKRTANRRALLEEFPALDGWSGRARGGERSPDGRVVALAV